MSEKSKIRRAKREAEQERKGKKVMSWIIGVLFALAIIFIGYTIYVVS